jgi:hypothetical protein
MNKAVAGTDAESKSLEEVVVSSWNNGSPTPVFNNAAQVCVRVGVWVGGCGGGAGKVPSPSQHTGVCVVAHMCGLVGAYSSWNNGSPTPLSISAAQVCGAAKGV